MVEQSHADSSPTCFWENDQLADESTFCILCCDADPYFLSILFSDEAAMRVVIIKYHQAGKVLTLPALVCCALRSKSKVFLLHAPDQEIIEFSLPHDFT
jgi:hypothetical protein